MKTIELTDEDYKELMDLIKEYKTQEHDLQAYPRMWTVECTHRDTTCMEYEAEDYVICNGDYTYLSSIIDDLKNDKYTDWIEDEEALEQFIKNPDEDDLIEYFKDNDYTVVPVKDEERKELNATLFKSDAKTHIKINGHKLKKNPHTYAFTPYRMPKMHRLVDILMKLDGDKSDENKGWL